MIDGLHRGEQYRSLIPGSEAFSIASTHSFPHRSHDDFGIGVLHKGAHRSWSGIGHVEAVAGDVITVNPGEMHDGEPVRSAVRAWRMLYLDPGLVARALREDLSGEAESARPVLHDPLLAVLFGRLFGSLTEAVPDALGAEESLPRMLALLLARHGSRPLPVAGPPPLVARALQRLREIPERPATLAELAALSGVSRFQLLRGTERR